AISAATAVVLIVTDLCFPEIVTSRQKVYRMPRAHLLFAHGRLPPYALHGTSATAQTRSVGSVLLPTLRTKHPKPRTCAFPKGRPSVFPLSVRFSSAVILK
ncbi:unnamed protein product, partial [Ectocarpus sp. 8 AP-2014]